MTCSSESAAGCGAAAVAVGSGVADAVGSGVAVAVGSGAASPARAVTSATTTTVPAGKPSKSSLSVTRRPSPFRLTTTLPASKV